MTADISVVGSSSGSVIMGRKGDKEVIHSGHFMVSDFEAEAQDDEENVLLEIPGDTYGEEEALLVGAGGDREVGASQQDPDLQQQQKIKRSKIETLSIDSSLTKLFNAMSIAYRQKITSPKWNRFKGLKLRWKDKIRLNNIIWRCWHMQFIRKKKMTVCQFALDVDIHNKPEAIVLEGKYWKRQLDAVTAEYKKWRIYYKNKISGRTTLESDTSLFELEGMDFIRTSGLPASLEEGDLNELMDFTDVLFNSLINNPSQPFAFPNPREIARGTGNSDFIQPGLIQLQPNLDDFMDIVEPLQEMLAGRGLAPVPEEGDLLGLAEVAEAPELPPPAQITGSTTPPSPLQYTARLTTATAFTPSPGHSDTASTFLQPTSPTPTSPARTKPLHHHQEVQQQQLYHQQEVQQQHVVVTLPSQSPPLYQSGIQLLQQQPHTTAQQQQQQQLHQPHTPPQQLHQPLTTTQQQLHQPHTSPQQLHQPHTPPQQLQQPHTPPQQLQQPHTPPQQLQQPHTTPQQLHQQPHTSSHHHHHHHHHQQQQPRSFIRSHSQHELGSNHQATAQQQSSFVIPKSLPRRRSHSSGGSSSSNSSSSGGGSGSVVVGTSSLSPHQVITTLPTTLLPVTSLTVTSIPISTSLPLSPATSLPHIAPAPSTTLPHIASASSVPHIAPATSTSTTTSNFLAQLLNSGTYQVSSSDGGSQLGALKTNIMTITNNNVKVPLVLPAEVVSSSTSSSSSSSGSSSSIKPVVTAALVAPPITLTAVTPSILKSQPFSQTMSPWSPCSPQGITKQSPPHQEPSSPLMVSIPSPPNKAFRVKSESDRVQYKEHRRVCHINAEQKRRSNLKNNFDILHQLIPSINQNSNAKISKAVMLQKGADYIHQLKSERQQLTEKADQLRAEIEALSNDISNSQAQLPATGAPMTHARYSKLKEMFMVYVRERTLASWKFYIFSLITEPLLESFNSSVSTSCLDDLCRSSLAWLDQQCSLNVLRPFVSSAMRKLSTTTSVLADPESLPEEIYRSVTKQETDRFHPR